MSVKFKMGVNRLAKAALVGFYLISFFHVGDVFAGAQTDQNLGTIAQNITGSFLQFGQLILAISFIAGLGFTMAAIFKFKQHKDNPTQIPLGTPIALLAIGIALIFLPGIIKPAGATLFGSSEATAGGFTGEGAAALPGSSSQ